MRYERKTKFNWAKAAFWVSVPNLLGQILLVVENFINLRGNGYL